jgi:predicted ATP-dependent endonuclease of OLD family
MLGGPYWFNDRVTRQQQGPVDRPQLNQAVAEGRLFPTDYVRVPAFAASTGGVTATSAGSFNARCSDLLDFDVIFDQTANDLVQKRLRSATTVLSGTNNCGKSLLLKVLRSQYANQAYLMGCNRFYHCDVIKSRDITVPPPPNPPLYVQQLLTNHRNDEANTIQLEHIFHRLTKGQRQILFRICGELLGTKVQMRKYDEDDELSSHYVEVAGENLRRGSTGTRLLLTLIGICLLDEFEVVLIDEPELGLSPKVQTAVGHYLCDMELRRQHFPHLKSVFLATHSNIFLNRSILADNFSVARSGHTISVKQVETMSDFHNLQFAMLGNRLELLYMPSVIVIVEGVTDFDYVKRLIQLSLPDRRVTVVKSEGDGDILKQLNRLNEIFGGLATSPYRDRIVLVFDKTTDVNITRLARSGVRQENVVQWEKNGIEYYYPVRILSSAFFCGDDVLDKLAFDGDKVSVNETSYSKKELCKLVVDDLRVDDILNSELREKLMDKIQQLVS